MKTYFYLLICTSLILATNESILRADTTVSSVDKLFVEKAAQGGMTEVALGKMAQEKAQDAKLKDFGAKMVSDHGKANDELKALAAAKGIPLQDQLNPMHQSIVNKLDALSGAAFDKAYAADMVKAHQKDDTLFAKEAANGTDNDIKAFASKTDVIVKEHLSMIQSIQDGTSSKM